MTRTSNPEIIELLDDLGINNLDREGTDKATRHNYTGIYAELLAPYRNKQCNFLEIGTRCGGSAVLWRNYLPKARLDLVDINFDIVPENIKRLNNFSFHEFDAYTPAAVEYFLGKKFDIINDDGSHEPSDLLFAAANYYQFLAPGGVLILEDIPHGWLVPKLTKLFSPEQQKRIRVFDMRDVEDRYDDLIWTISKEEDS